MSEDSKTDGICLELGGEKLVFPRAEIRTELKKVVDEAENEEEFFGAFSNWQSFIKTAEMNFALNRGWVSSKIQTLVLNAFAERTGEEYFKIGFYKRQHSLKKEPAFHAQREFLEELLKIQREVLKELLTKKGWEAPNNFWGKF